MKTQTDTVTDSRTVAGKTRVALVTSDPSILNRIIARAERAELQRDYLLAACKSAFDVLEREGPSGFDSASERLSTAINGI